LKRTIILFILLPFLYLNIGVYPFFLIKQQLIKKEIKLKLKGSIPNGELTTFVFDKTTFKSIKWLNKKEFSFNDHMYDVVKIENTNNDSIQVKCIDDKKEKLLFTQLEKLTKTSEKSKKNKELFLSKLLLKYFVPTKELTFERYYKIINCFILKIVLYNSFVIEKPSPPPKFC